MYDLKVERLFKAVENNEIEHVKVILDMVAAHINLNKEYGETSILAGYVRAQNENGKTALHIAAEKGEIEIVKLLLKNNADSKIVDKNGHTAIDLAFLNKHQSVVDYFVEEGCKVNPKILQSKVTRSGSVTGLSLFFQHRNMNDVLTAKRSSRLSTILDFLCSDETLPIIQDQKTWNQIL